MTIANILYVPVEKLEIVKIPGINTVKESQNWWIAGDTTNRKRLTFTFRTAASSVTFTRRVYILHAQAYEFITVRNPEDSLSTVADRNEPVSRVQLEVLVENKVFRGSFDYLKKTGELHAHQFNLQDGPREALED